ncbi:hypothetical protein Lfu02_80120 [Longispora fulva]|uniref:Uncharacterized protein n=1 Tax=Longispora fulva TaxID=619741 RepID=A0A8J7KTF7_9ACTN|nr:hypothetical protein [Longispora fulva]MBG6140682.1 hypothetical protein [Longispora fulva]GIG63640.1 hypothetical protein Lfu02_80120 [Longispora fulva]
MILPHTLTVHYSEASLDPDGNPVRRPGPVGVDVAAFVQPHRTREAGDGPGSDEQLVAYLDGDAAQLDAWSAAVSDGVRFELLGPAQRHGSPDQTVAYWRVILRRAR